MAPSNTLTSITTPWYESNQLSKMRALSGFCLLSSGGGIRCMIDSRISCIPIPAFALASVASVASMPTISSISLFTLSGSAEGRSILFITGMSSSPESTAKYALATVWASTPWEASTTSSAPSQASRLLDTS